MPVTAARCRRAWPSVRAMAEAPSQAEPAPAYRCTECGWETAKWVGRCGECQAWGSVAEAAAPDARAAAGPVTTRRPCPIAQVSVEDVRVPHQRRARARPGARRRPGARGRDPARRRARRRQEHAAARGRRADRALPTPHALRHRRGVGLPGAAARRPHRRRARRALPRRRDRPRRVLTHIEQVRPELLVVDSVQTIGAADVDGVPGGVTQVKEVAAALIRVAKTRNITTIIVGHVTKDGSIAGPRVLEHVVDVVLHFEGDRNSRFRMVRAMKNRFGPVDEVGCFDLGADGIAAVTDPTGLFVENHHQPVPGTCVAVTMEGRRPMLAEVQALVTPTARRAAAAYDVRARLLAGGDGARRAPAALRHPRCTPTTSSPRPSAGPG